MIDVYLEIVPKRAIASAVDWPGWARGGRDEPGALQALLAYASRYARAMRDTDLGFESPADLAALNVVARLPGDAGTEFGAISVPFPGDDRPVGESQLARYQTLLRACWRALDDAAAAATDRELRKGPRGGGRALADMVRHVTESERAYLMRIGQKAPVSEVSDPAALQTMIRQAVADGLAVAVREGVEPVGPRGGRRWTPREFVRHVAWHVLDHAWEIEDRVV